MNKVLPDDLAESMCWVYWCTSCDEARTQEEQRGHGQSPRSHHGACFCVEVCAAWVYIERSMKGSKGRLSCGAMAKGFA